MNYIIIDSGQNGLYIAAVPDNIADNIKYYGAADQMKHYSL